MAHRMQDQDQGGRAVPRPFRAMLRPTRFHARLMAGYVAITVMLVAGMELGIRSFVNAASSALNRIETDQADIVQAEHLRSQLERIESADRGYLLSGDERLLQTVRGTEADFDRGLRRLRKQSSDPEEKALLDQVEQAASRFTSARHDLLATRALSGNPQELFRRFEDELLPFDKVVHGSLDRLVELNEASVKEHDTLARAEERRLFAGVRTALAGLAVLGLLIAWFLAGQVARSFRKEEEALVLARAAIVTRDDMMAVVAHDLRNPLGAITLKAALLREDADSDSIRQTAASIERVALGMESLIKAMLDAATMEAGRFSVRALPCPVAEVVREAMDLFEGAAASKGLRLEQAVEAPELTMLADRDRIRQALSNLLGNAVKFTPRGGVVRLSAERTGDAVVFAVSDSGPGIAESDLPRVFERFWKGRATGRAGTGLGLFIARGIVEAHGGQIGVENRDHGSRFYFSIPLLKPDDERAGGSVNATSRPLHVSPGFSVSRSARPKLS